jgi:hypothetical protein
VARAGWEAQPPAQSQINPIYEQMRYPYTREGMLAQFVTYSTPDWRIFGMFGLLILTLRYYRYRNPIEQSRARAQRDALASTAATPGQQEPAEDTRKRAA